MDTESVKSLRRGSAMEILVHFSIFDDMPSWPVDFVVSRSDSRSRSDSSVHRFSTGQLSDGGNDISGDIFKGDDVWLK